MESILETVSCEELRLRLKSCLLEETGNGE